MMHMFLKSAGIGRRMCIGAMSLLVTLTFILGAAQPLSAAEAGNEGQAAAQEEAASTPAPADPSVVTTNGISGWPQFKDIYSDSGVLIDADTGTILYDKAMDRQMYPASVTKLMTALLALENGNLEDQVSMTATGTAYCENGSSNLYTQVGEVFTLEQLLYGTMLKSANDMATQVGEYIGGTLENFIQMMNDRAVSLGCTGTHFENACGMPNDAHMTTAHDLALIAQAALKIPKFREIVNTSNYTIPPTNMTSTERTMTNHNALLVVPEYFYPGIIGGKTGYTDAAQSCLSNFASRNGMTLIVVTLHAMDGSYAAQDNVDLLDYGYNNFKLVDVGLPEYITSGGKVMIPSDADISRCTVEVEESEGADGSKMVNWVYYYSGHRVGNILMTAENAEAYEQYLIKEEKKNEEKEKKNSKKNSKSDKKKAADDQSVSDESASASAVTGVISSADENAMTESHDGVLPNEVRAELDEQGKVRGTLVKVIIGLVIFMVLFVVVMLIALHREREKKRIRKRTKKKRK